MGTCKKEPPPPPPPPPPSPLALYHEIPRAVARLQVIGTTPAPARPAVVAVLARPAGPARVTVPVRVRAPPRGPRAAPDGGRGAVGLHGGGGEVVGGAAAADEAGAEGLHALLQAHLHRAVRPDLARLG